MIESLFLLLFVLTGKFRFVWGHQGRSDDMSSSVSNYPVRNFDHSHFSSFSTFSLQSNQSLMQQSHFQLEEYSMEGRLC